MSSPQPDDQLGWEVEQHGRMRDAAAPDDAVETVPYEPEGD